MIRLSEEGLSLPSLDLGEERVNENSRESSEFELRLWEWEKEVVLPQSSLEPIFDRTEPYI